MSNGVIDNERTRTFEIEDINEQRASVIQGAELAGVIQQFVHR